MRAFYFFVKITFPLIIILLLSCVEEDLDLVNPPPQKESVMVRFFNLSGNHKSASLVLDGQTVYGPVDFGICSAAQPPPSDSSNASVVQEASEVYRLNRKIRFSRNNHYTIFALPTAEKDTLAYRDVDTLIIASTLSGLIVREDYSYLRIFNAVPKLNRNYSLRLGCPNGYSLAAYIGYRRMSSQSEVPSDGTPVSILRTIDNKTEILGLFNLNLSEKNQYMIVVLPDEGEGEQLMLLDETNKEYHPLIPMFKEANLSTSIRAINMSESKVEFIKYPDSTLSNGVFQSLSGKTIGDYVSVSACGGQSLDTLACITGTDTASVLKASLNVAERYTIITFDSANTKAKTTVLAEPSRLKSESHAFVRVVHAAYNRQELIVSMASRDENPNSNNEDSLGYRSGDLLSEKISYGGISNPKLILPGEELPITVFTTTEPANLVYTTTADFKAGGRYLLLITTEYPSGKTQIYLIEENDNSNSTLKALEEGVFVQFVNLVPGAQQLQLSLEPVLTKAKMHFGAILSTVISEGTHILSFNGKDTVIDVKSEDRCLFIFAGDNSSVDVLPFIYQPEPVSASYYQRRFINAGKEVGMISVKENDVDSSPIAERIGYGKSSVFQKITLDRNLSLFFVKTEDDSLLYRVDDMPFPFGKNYTIIFGGNSKDKSYSVVVQQEY